MVPKRQLHCNCWQMSAYQPYEALGIALAQLVKALTPSAVDWERRQRLVSEHLQLLSSKLKSNHSIHISTFGSSLSGLCLADSDIDVGLFGRFNGCLLESLTPKQQQSLLRLVLNAVYAAKLARNQQVQPIWGARVPVLKYTCQLSGLQCDISLQGAGALVKANFIHILSINCKQLSALYRLVKLWAQAHDLNDASRSTLNSTSLLYMTIFHLQQLQLLPPLKVLVPPELLLQPGARLLQGSNRQLWENPQQLGLLLGAVQANMRAWAHQRQQQQQQLQEPGISELLHGFFQFWTGALSAWVLGKGRHLHADLWHGAWGHGCFPKEYIFSLQDPFDPSDCPARAVGSSSNTNGGTAAFIAYIFDSSSKVMQRCKDNCMAQMKVDEFLAEVHQQHSGSKHDNRHHQQQPQTLKHPPTATAAGVGAARIEICRVLSWLFGPQAVVSLGSYEPQQRTGGQPIAAAAGVPWAAAPFPRHLVLELQQRQQADPALSRLMKWLVEQLGAELDKDRNILCLSQLPLLYKHVHEAAAVAAKQVRGSLLQHHQPAAAVGSTDGQLAQQQAEEKANNSSSRVPLHGPPLLEPDSNIAHLQQHLSLEVQQQQRKMFATSNSKSPKRLPKAVRVAVKLSLAAVADRLLHVQQQCEEGISSSSRYGFIAVLEQHGFTGVLQELGVLRDGVLWRQALPPQILDDSSCSRSGSGGTSTGADCSASSSGTATAAVAPSEAQITEVSDAPAASTKATASSCSATAAASNSNSMSCALAALSDTDSQEVSSRAYEPRLVDLLLAVSSSSASDAALSGASVDTSPLPVALNYLYTLVFAANQHQLAAAEAAGCSSSKVAAAAATAGVAAAGGECQPVYSVAVRGAHWYSVVQLPELVSLVWGADQSFRFIQIVPPGTERRLVIKNGGKVAKKNNACKALRWLDVKRNVTPAVIDALQVLQLLPDQGLQYSQEQQQSDDTEGQQQTRIAQQQPVERLRQHKSGGSSSNDSAVAPLRSQEQHQMQPAAVAAAAGADDVAAGLAELSLAETVGGVDCNGAAAAAAGPKGPQSGHTQHPAEERAVYKQVRRLRERIHTLEQRIIHKQEKLEFDQQQMAALQDEQQQAVALATTKQQQVASSSNSDNLLCGSVAGTSSTHGDFLLQLAMQQSMQEMLKGIRNQLNDAKSKVHSDKEALQKFESNLQQLKQQESIAVAALLAFNGA